ncbi:hypothetical protein VNI00_013410 [Paramarasmius palmivorus]|uniref:SET domain-containing protein n=1 Tax=Paramarasmius palmivorus TaxID=297713 RepID=A0AAW0BYU6_9AGAR
MKRGFLKTAKAFPKDTVVAPRGSREPAKSQNEPRPLFYDLAEQSREIGGLKREKVPHYNHRPLDYILKDTGQVELKDSDWIITNLPSTDDASVEDKTACLITGRAKRLILNTPGYPQPLPCPSKPDCFRMQEIPGKGRGLVATKDIKWGDLIFAERALIISPVALPATGCESLTVPSHFTEPQKRQVVLDECERQFQLLIDAMSPEGQAAYKDLWNCHKEDGSGPLVGISRTNGEMTDSLCEQFTESPSSQVLALKIIMNHLGYPERSSNYSGTWNLISRLNHSCRPNVGVNWDSPSFSMQVRAGRDIEAGEELCISYLRVGPGELLKLTASRQYDLRSYGFECICPACTNAATSDARCKEIQDVSKPQIMMLAQNDFQAMLRQQKESMERAITLIEVEGLQLAEEYGNLLSRMFQVCGAMRDPVGARKYEKMYQTFLRATKSTKNSVNDKKEEDDRKQYEEMQRQMVEHMQTMGYRVTDTSR